MKLQIKHVAVSKEITEVTVSFTNELKNWGKKPLNARRTLLWEKERVGDLKFKLKRSH